MLSNYQGHIDTALTDVSVMYKNADFVADQIFPVIPVQKQSDKYFVYGLDNLRSVADSVAPTGLANQMEMTLQPGGPYYADGHALMDWVPDEEEEGVDAPIDPDIDTTQSLTDVILLNKEINLVNTLANAMTPIDLSATAYANAWDNSTGTDPITQIDKAKETIELATGMRPNTLVLSRPVWRGMRNNPTVKSRVSGALEGIDKTLITAAQMAATCEVDNVIIAPAVNVTSKLGQTVASSYVWQKYALLFYKPKSPGIRTVALGYEFRWQKGKMGSLVYRGRSDRRHADWIEVRQYYAQQMIAPAAGVLWTNTTQN